MKKNKRYFFTITYLSFYFFAISQTQINAIPGLKIWLRADSSVVLNSGKVTDWIDISGNNYIFTQNTPTMQPTLLYNTLLNNKPYLNFDGFTKLQSIVAFSFSNCSIFCLCSQNVGDNVGGRLIDHDNANGFWFGTLSNTDQFGGGFIESSFPYGNYQDIIKGTPFLFSAIRENSVVSSFLNQIPFTTPTRTTLSTPTILNPISLGASISNGAFGKKDIYEIIVFDTVVSIANQIIIEQYLINKYAPPITLPSDISLINSFCDTTIASKGYFSNYQWSTGDTTPAISVNGSGKYWVTALNVFGKTSSDTINVQITKPSNYNFKDSSFCTGNQLKWNTQLPKSNYTFLWQDNTTTDSVFTITQPGNYYVKINDSFGCSITSDTAKIVEDNFVTTASLGPDVSLCAGNLITLTSGASSSLAYTWSTGSNNDSLLITASGQYSVIVTNTNNCVAKDTINVTVLGQAPTANFSFNAGCLNTAVSFTNLSVPPSGNTIISSDWTFGDPSSASSNTSTATNPFHTFSDTGTYSIKLKVITNAGCEQTITKTIHIAPTPTVNFSNGISCQNDSTALSSSIITSSGYSITSVAWNFGDPASGINNTSNLSSPKHLFSNQTTYLVTLIATNNAGCATSLTKSIAVKAEVKADFTNSPPCSNTAVIFQDNSIAPIGSSRLWNLPGTQSGLTATKTYTSSGVYSVTLTVTGTNFCTSKITKQIIVFQPPAVNFTIPSFCSKDTITAINQSVAQSGIISSYNWKLNNTTFSSAQNPTLTAINAGTYSVKLIVGNSFNCKDSLTKPVTVLPLPNADFTTNPATYYFINSPVNFIPTITNASSYLWNISGVPTTSIQSPTLSFSAEGTYTASLNIQDLNGCKNSKTKTILVSKRYLDLAVLNVNTTKDNDGFITVETDVANYGSVPVTTFDIHYKISDGGNIKETWNGILNPNAFYVYTFAAKSASQKNNTNNITCVEIEKVNGVIDENIGNNKLCNPLNADEISVSNPIPNPTDADITLPIILNKDMDFTIAIYNSTGQIIYEETTQKGTTGLNFVTLPTSTYARGCYIIKTMIDGKIFIKKFIKISNE